MYNKQFSFSILSNNIVHFETRSNQGRFFRMVQNDPKKMKSELNIIKKWKKKEKIHFHWLQIEAKFGDNDNKKMITITNI